MAFLVGSTAPGLQRLAVPFASLLIAVLGYGSQWLFATSPDLEPGPLTTTQSRVFNALLVCLWWTYWRACTVDPGRYEFPRSVNKKDDDDGKAAVAKGNKGARVDEDAATHTSEDEEEDEEGHGDDDDDNGDDNNDEKHGGRQAREPGGGNHPSDGRVRTAAAAAARRRWCRKCAAPKPPRAHHCKTCGRCVPKMDHHCPWTGNCVSLQTFPHFLRFVAYTNASLWMLLYLLSQRLAALWASRDLPAYLGPSLPQLVALTGLSLAAGLTALMLALLLLSTARGWALNTTMIEGWEIERHEAVLQRGGYGDGGGDGDDDGWWRASDGDADAAPRAMVDPLEFPYDVGVWANMAQAMGTANPLAWPLPFAGGPRVARLPAGVTLDAVVARLSGAAPATAPPRLGVGWAYEENGLNDAEGLWPPVDPDKVRNARLWRRRRREEARYRKQWRDGLRDPALPLDAGLSPEQGREAFRRRQERDLQRWRGTRAHIMSELEEEAPAAAGEEHSYRYGGGYADADATEPYRPRQNVVLSEGRSAWVNADGEHLGDYGVDEDAEFDDDDYVFDDGPGRGEEASHLLDPDDEEVPLAELIRRRKIRTKDGEDT